MGPTVINGLPAHVLLVHLVVVFVPLAALALVLSAVWPAARRRLGIITPILALVAVAVIPPTTHAGAWLVRRVDPSPQVRAHAELADGLLPWAIGMFLLAAALWVVFTKVGWLGRASVRRAAPDREPALVSGGGATEASPDAEAGTDARPAADVRPASAGRAMPTWIRVTRVAVVVLAVVVSVGSVVEVYRIGDSGAQAAWHDSFSMAPTHGH